MYELPKRIKQLHEVAVGMARHSLPNNQNLKAYHRLTKPEVIELNGAILPTNPVIEYNSSTLDDAGTYVVRLTGEGILQYTEAFVAELVEAHNAGFAAGHAQGYEQGERNEKQFPRGEGG